jgi:hypothetical protein
MLSNNGSDATNDVDVASGNLHCRCGREARPAADLQPSIHAVAVYFAVIGVIAAAVLKLLGVL